MFGLYNIGKTTLTIDTIDASGIRNLQYGKRSRSNWTRGEIINCNLNRAVWMMEGLKHQSIAMA